MTDRAQERRTAQRVDASLKLEVTWTLIPLILVVIIFVVGFRGYMNMATPPASK